MTERTTPEDVQLMLGRVNGSLFMRRIGHGSCVDWGALEKAVSKVLRGRVPRISNHKRHGRAKPYTDRGVERLPCIRCGEKAYTSWSICADGNLNRPVCRRCDIELNRMVLEWAGDPEIETKMLKYEDVL